MHQLPADTVRLLSSAQVITSVLSAVKELIENSVDANADNIEVKLENFGLDRIEVRDNGDGISPEDAEVMGQRHFTSKLKEFSDLTCVSSYGFRGEALGSLCAVSDVTITTKRECDPISKAYSLSHHGIVVASKPSHLGKGTTVCAINLFKNVPVRKQYYSSAKRKKEELKKVEDLLMCYGVIKPRIRFALSHNKCNIWQKNLVKTTKNALLNTIGSNLMNQLQFLVGFDEVSKIRVEGYVPKPEADVQIISRSQSDRTWFVINSRPVQFKEAEKLLKQYFTRLHDTIKPLRHLVAYLQFSVPLDNVDVNVEPNKTKVLLQNNDAVLSLLTHVLEGVYPNKTTENPNTSLPSLPDLADSSSDQTNSQLSSRPEKQSLIEGWTPLMTKQSNNGNSTDKSRGIQQGSRLKEALGDEVSLNSVVLDAAVENICPVKPSETFTQLDKADRDVLKFSLFDEKVLLGTQVTSNSKEVDNNFQTGTNSSSLSKAKSNDASEKDINERLIGNVTESIEQEISKEDWSKGVGVLDGNRNDPVQILVPGATIETYEMQDFEKGNEPSVKITNANSIYPTGNIPLLPVLQTNGLFSDKHSHAVSNPVKESETLIGSNDQGDHISNLPSSDHLASSHAARLEAPKGSPERKLNSNSVKGSPGRHKNLGSPGNLYDLLGQKPVRRPQDSYTHFRRIMRPQVAAENLDADDATIDLLLEEGWEQLAEEERQKYENIAARDRKRYESHLNAAQNNSGVKRRKDEDENPRKRKKVEPPSNQGRIDQMLASQQRRHGHSSANQKEENKISETTVLFSMDFLKKHDQPKRAPERTVMLVGPLPSFHVWLALEEKNLVVFNVYRAEEAILYRRLTSNHVLPCNPLDLPVVLDTSVVGGEDNWLTLLSLENEALSEESVKHFIDKRLVSNGFNLRQIRDEESNNIRIEIVSMTTVIACYGVPDLVEILGMITHSRNIHLSDCRPLKVKNYLKSEAVRIARSRPKDVQADDMLDIIGQVHKTFPEEQRICVHGKPIAHKLCKIS